MGDPGFENVLDGLVLAHPEGDDKRPVRSFLLDLLSREHLAPLEIVADLGVDQNGDLQVSLLGKPDIRAALKGCIQILGNPFEYASGEAGIRNLVESVALENPSARLIADQIPETTKIDDPAPCPAAYWKPTRFFSRMALTIRLSRAPPSGIASSIFTKTGMVVTQS